MDETQQEKDSPRESSFRRVSSISTGKKRSYIPITRSIRKVGSEKDSNFRKYAERRINVGSGFSFSLGTLVIIICLFVITIGPSLLQLAEQYDQRNKAVAELNLAKLQNQKLREELENWQDSAFVMHQAKRRLGFAEPGETRYIVLDENGKNITNTNLESKLPARPWYLIIAASVEAAGEADKNAKITSMLEPEKGTPSPDTSNTKKKKR